MEPLKKRFEELLQDVKQAIAKLGILELERERNMLRAEMAQTGFWDNKPKAQELSKKEGELSQKIEPWLGLRRGVEGMLDLAGDDALKDDLVVELDGLEKMFEELKKDLQFKGPYDDHNVIMSIYAGAGGTDAQDWAQMLLRMYTRWAEDHKLTVKTVDQSSGESAGIKSVTLEIRGDSFLYGKLSGEHGVHRLVRKSPFNSAASRETSFAKVDVLPMIDRPEEVLIDDKDLKIDTYRAGGHGGQSVNTTDSAVRVTHIPTGVSVAIQNERSQLQNKETALTILRSRLAQLQIEQHVETLSEIKGPSQANEFGSQIRNYILDDRILKDLRTGYENHDPQKVLDGDLDPLIEAWLGKVN